MESLGDKLRAEREQRGSSIEQVARDTNIAKRFLVALEEENFEVFPGETYLLGFLRNYADYLGLDAENMVTLFRNFMIQEQPVPIDELLVKKSRSPIIAVLAVTLPHDECRCREQHQRNEQKKPLDGLGPLVHMSIHHTV